MMLDTPAPTVANDGSTNRSARVEEGQVKVGGEQDGHPPVEEPAQQHGQGPLGHNQYAPPEAQEEGQSHQRGTQPPEGRVDQRTLRGPQEGQRWGNQGVPQDGCEHHGDRGPGTTGKRVNGKT